MVSPGYIVRESNARSLRYTIIIAVRWLCQFSHILKCSPAFNNVSTYFRWKLYHYLFWFASLPSYFMRWQCFLFQAPRRFWCIESILRRYGRHIRPTMPIWAFDVRCYAVLLAADDTKTPPKRIKILSHCFLALFHTPLHIIEIAPWLFKPYLTVTSAFATSPPLTRACRADADATSFNRASDEFYLYKTCGIDIYCRDMLHFHWYWCRCYGRRYHCSTAGLADDTIRFRMMLSIAQETFHLSFQYLAIYDAILPCKGQCHQLRSII